MENIKYFCEQKFLFEMKMVQGIGCILNLRSLKTCQETVEEKKIFYETFKALPKKFHLPVKSQ